MKTAGFSYLFVCSICHEVLFWLKYMGENLASASYAVGKGKSISKV